VAIQSAGIKVLPNIINAWSVMRLQQQSRPSSSPCSLLVFTLSAANSDQYIATRTLYGMAKDGNAPRIFTKCNKRGVPWCVRSAFPVP
jgi:amino acid transporter